MLPPRRAEAGPWLPGLQARRVQLQDVGGHQAKDADALAKQLDLHVEHIRDGRSADDLLYEILLKSGFPLTTPVETITLAAKQVHSVAERRAAGLPEPRADAGTGPRNR